MLAGELFDGVFGFFETQSRLRAICLDRRDQVTGLEMRQNFTFAAGNRALCARRCTRHLAALNRFDFFLRFREAESGELAIRFDRLDFSARPDELTAKRRESARAAEVRLTFPPRLPLSLVF